MKSAFVCIAFALCSVLTAQNLDATFVNGVDGYIVVPASPSLAPPTAITLEAWVLFNNVGLNPTNLFPTIARKNVANGQEEYFLRVQGTGALRWKIKTGAATSLSVDTPGPMAGGVWTHVAGTYDGAVSRLYVNGVQVAQTSGAGAPFNGNGDLRIGKGDDQLAPSEVWSGQIDEVRIWSVARTQAQIQATMNWELSTGPNLVSSWQLSANGNDALGANHGVVFGSVAFGASSLPLNTGPAPWQTNHPEMSIDIDGVLSEGYSPAIVTRTFTPCSLATVTVNLSSTVTGNPWDIALTAGPGYPANAGGFFTPNGQAVNLSLADPTLAFLFFPNPSPPLSSVSIPAAFGGPVNLSAQGFTVTGLHPDGIVISQLFELHVAAGPGSVAGPTADDGVVTVPLSHPSLCGAPPTVPFFGTNYSQFDVLSNGRLSFGAPTPNTTGVVSLIGAQLGSYPFVGAWSNLSPNLGGSIAVSVPAPNQIRVDWTNVRYAASPLSTTFGVQIDANLGVVSIDGLGGIPAALGVTQFLGISQGLLGPATNPGATIFSPGGPFATAFPTDMIYALGDAGTLANGLTAIIFVPSFSGGYDWFAF
jgi:hypothetical protein